MQIYDRATSCWKDVLLVDHFGDVVLIKDVNTGNLFKHQLSHVCGWIAATVWEISYTDKVVDDVAHYLISNSDKKVAATYGNEQYHIREINYTLDCIYMVSRSTQLSWTYPLSVCKDLVVYTDLFYKPDVHTQKSVCDCGGAKANTTHSQWCSTYVK